VGKIASLRLRSRIPIRRFCPRGGSVTLQRVGVTLTAETRLHT
jgi:hypothetical protein